MSDSLVMKLVKEIDQVDFSEFWWDSQLLKVCSQVKDPRIVRALLIRHHCLGNKSADSAHVVRNTIKELEGPDFPTLWKLIDAESDTNALIASIDDHMSLPWAAAYVLGELGGAQALSETTRRLTSAHVARHFLTAKLAFHLVVRYSQIQNEGEPTIVEMDTKTGRQVSVPTKDRFPDLYERQMLRRRQANEYFVPVPLLMLAYLKSHLSKVPDSFIPVPKQELFSYIDHIPTTHDDEPLRSQSVELPNASGRTAGAVERGPDGRSTIRLGADANFTTLLTSSFAIFADDLSPRDKAAFSGWAGLPADKWGPDHRRAFALALLHYLYEAKRNRRNIPAILQQAAQALPAIPPEPLQRPLTQGIERMFLRLFGEA